MSKRRLSDDELQEVQIVFGDSLDYERVWLIENTAWPNWVARFRAFLTRSKAPAKTAITLGNRMYFPVKLLNIMMMVRLKKLIFHLI